MIRSNDLWLGGGLLALVVLGSVLLGLPNTRERSSLLAEASELSGELSGPSDSPEAIGRLRERLEMLREFGEGRTTPIPEQSDIAGLMSQVGGVMDASGLEQREITTQEPRALDDASALSISLRLEGPFDAIYEAVRGIEGLPRLVRVGRLRLEAVSERRGGPSRAGVVRADILVEAFFAPSGGSVEGGGAS